MTCIAGVDPGKNGGLVLLHTLPGDFAPDVEAYVMPVIQEFAAIMLSNKKAHVFIEKAQSFPGGGVSGMFNYGQHFGELLGVLWAYDIPHTLVPPRTWSKVLHAGTAGTDTKKRSVEAAQRLYPNVRLSAGGERAKRPHLGIVEALLIAEFGRRQLK